MLVLLFDNDATLVGLGDLTDGNTLLAIFGIVLTIILMTRGWKGAIFIGMIITNPCWYDGWIN